MVLWDIICLLVDIGRVVILKLLVNDDNSITSQWKIYSNIKCIIVDEGVGLRDPFLMLEE